MDPRISDILGNIFGFRSFLPNQEEIVAAILERQDVFVVMPTGGGKSLCYQLPARILEGTCVVISPLISLMKDQVDAAAVAGLQAEFLNSALSAFMKRKVESRLAAGELDLIYVSPERLAMQEFNSLLKRIKISFFAIDEAHCISEWGHDFRPDYLGLSTLVEEYPGVPIAAFTATATHKVQEDIVTKLGLRSPRMVRASFNRPNLFYKVIPKENPGAQILRFAKARAGEPGIVYRTTRKSVEQTAQMLVRHGIRALPYHAGLEDAERARNQDAFNRDEVDVIVATIAFGMGIDKSNVRYVLHGDLPKNIESYYQETGRSGRDGESATCQLLFGAGDIPKIRFFLDAIPDDAERAHQLRCLGRMISYASTRACRRKQLLNYFGEPFEPNAETQAHGRCCDVCEGEVESEEATVDAQKIMSAIARTGERFGIGHIVSVVTGDATDRICQLGHDRIKTFGVGRGREPRHWRRMIDHLLAQGLVLQTSGDYPVLKLMPEAREVLFGGKPVHVLKMRQPIGKRARRAAAAEAAGPYNEVLFEQLRDLRKTLAAEQGVPPYVVFTDRTLHEMARSFPVTESTLLQITGVGEKRAAQYGPQFLQAIREFREAHSLVLVGDGTPMGGDTR